MLDIIFPFNKRQFVFQIVSCTFLVMERNTQKLRAQVYEWGGNYDKMSESLKSLIYLSEFENYEFDDEERCLISNCIKKKVSESRNRIHQIILEQKEQGECGNHEYVEICDDYILTLRKEIQIFLNSISDSVDHLVAITNKGKLFKGKVRSDLSRYFLEFGFSNVSDSRMIHEEVYKLANNYSDPFDPLVLGFILNFSIFLVERCNEKGRALEILMSIRDKLESQHNEVYMDQINEASKNAIKNIKEYIQEWSKLI
ncbi:hypothetical protein FG379_003463 [Cryptosporidium bovis]|uniref:uncharacterized protein n=1 Tax=Cryptosporidium bovis TaxID=310047 RepID=UPI00351A15E7|nr:hypothetical protein FG379_003463 [Cryptosporidium bovis]